LSVFTSPDIGLPIGINPFFPPLSSSFPLFTDFCRLGHEALDGAPMASPWPPKIEGVWWWRGTRKTPPPKWDKAFSRVLYLSMGAITYYLLFHGYSGEQRNVLHALREWKDGAVHDVKKQLGWDDDEHTK